MKFLSITTGLGLILFSLIFCAITLLAVIDPAGAKMADDNDPFGPPPSRLSSLALLGAFIGVGAAGVYLVARPWRPQRDATNVA